MKSRRAIATIVLVFAIALCGLLALSLSGSDFVQQVRAQSLCPTGVGMEFPSRVFTNQYTVITATVYPTSTDYGTLPYGLRLGEEPSEWTYSDSNPTQIAAYYETPGYILTVLSVVAGGGCPIVEARRFVTVEPQSGCPSIELSFSPERIVAGVPFTTSITLIPTNIIYQNSSYVLDYGDGHTIEGILDSNPFIHLDAVYGAGNYTATLTVNIEGCGSIIITKTYQVWPTTPVTSGKLRVTSSYPTLTATGIVTYAQSDHILITMSDSTGTRTIARDVPEVTESMTITAIVTEGLKWGEVVTLTLGGSQNYFDIDVTLDVVTHTLPSAPVLPALIAPEWVTSTNTMIFSVTTGTPPTNLYFAHLSGRTETLTPTWISNVWRSLIPEDVSTIILVNGSSFLTGSGEWAPATKAKVELSRDMRPQVSSVTPSGAAPGNVVTIRGRHFLPLGYSETIGSCFILICDPNMPEDVCHRIESSAVWWQEKSISLILPSDLQTWHDYIIYVNRGSSYGWAPYKTGGSVFLPLVIRN